MDAAPSPLSLPKVAKHVRKTNKQPQRKMRNFLLERGGGVGTMGEYPAVDSDARGRGSGVRVARDL